MNPQSFYGPNECFLCLWKLDTGNLLTIIGAVSIIIVCLGYVYHRYRVDNKI